MQYEALCKSGAEVPAAFGVTIAHAAVAASGCACARQRRAHERYGARVGAGSLCVEMLHAAPASGLFKHRGVELGMLCPAGMKLRRLMRRHHIPRRSRRRSRHYKMQSTAWCYSVRLIVVTSLDEAITRRQCHQDAPSRICHDVTFMRWCQAR